MRIFVYGTLKSGHNLNKFTIGSDNSSKKICDGYILGYDMYTNGFYPYIIKSDTTNKVTGEVWEINDSVVMSELRLIERQYEEREVNVITEDGNENCIAFVYENSISPSWNKVEDGIFK